MGQAYQGVTSQGLIKRARHRYDNFIAQILKQLETVFIKQGYLLPVIGFLLGRAVVMEKFSPFALAFFVSVFLTRRSQALQVLFALVLGSLTLGWENIGFHIGAISLFLILYRLYTPALNRRNVFIASYVFAAGLAFKFIVKYIFSPEMNIYDVLVMLIEAGMATILVLIFIQCIPLFSFKKKSTGYKTEEVVSLVIMVASILTGTIGWQLFDLSLSNVFSRFLVLLFASVSGAAMGTTVGVVTGLVFSLSNLSSLYQVSLLAFSGLLGGLLREGRRLGTALGLLIATVLIGLYADGQENVLISLYESSVAIMLFLLIPKKLLTKLAEAIPGTDEHDIEQQQYARKVRDVTAHRVNQFSDVFQALSNSFSNISSTPAEADASHNHELDVFLSKVTEKSCQNCFKKSQCWNGNFDKTYRRMSRVLDHISNDGEEISVEVQADLKKFCVKFNRVTEAMKQELSSYLANQKLKQQVQESRRLVAEQLQGVSKVMEDFANEIQKERQNLQTQEEQIRAAIYSFGIEVDHIEIFSLEQRNVDIEMMVSDSESFAVGEKLIAPMLSEILKEYIQLQNDGVTTGRQFGSTRLVFRSAKRYLISTGVANAAKGGGLISGDSYTMLEIGRGKQAVAISDGMGNGVRARAESTETLQLLQKILASGIEEKVAIRSINSILSLRTTDEIFSTLDLAMIDLQDGQTKFLKIGSTPSFIRRGNTVRKIQGSNLPIGIVKEFDVDVIHEQLLAGDLLIMMSDGIFEAPGVARNYEVWMSRKIKDIETNDPQEVADLILEEVIRTNSGMIDDDMTVLVVRMETNLPKWSNIKVEVAL